MTKTILAFGDSNTFGTPPMEQRTYPIMRRFDTDTRWPCVAAKKTGWTMIEAGLPGRTATGQPNPIGGDIMNGPLGLRIALMSCGPIDNLVIMLGTNDAQNQMGLSSDGIASALSALLAIALSDEFQTRHSGFEVLLVCPPPVREIGVFRQEFFGGESKTQDLRSKLAALADVWGVDFLDAGTVMEVSDVDGVHFEADQQVKLGNAIGAYLNTTA